jgi:hypothetical protein
MRDAEIRNRVSQSDGNRGARTGETSLSQILQTHCSAKMMGLIFPHYGATTNTKDLLMTEKQINLSARLKMLGFAKGNQMKLYGQVFELVSEPIVMSDNVVLVDAMWVGSQFAFPLSASIVQAHSTPCPNLSSPRMDNAEFVAEFRERSECTESLHPKR